MEIFKETPSIDFVENRWKAFILSGVLIGGSVVLFMTRGLNYAIDFTGGYVIQLTYETPMNLETLRGELVKGGFSDAIPQHFTGTNTFAIKIKTAENKGVETVEAIVKTLRDADPAGRFTEDKKEFVGPTVGKHLFKQAMFAMIFSLLGIIVYVAFRFSNPLWGIAGVVALIHDMIATTGLFVVFRMEFDLILVATLLTIAGYSINDTIVIFDRVREKMRLMRGADFGTIANQSINETLSRTLITSLTVFITSVVLQAIGGKAIHDFAAGLTFGVVVGTYSSVAVALPIVYQWEKGRVRPHGKPSVALAPSGASQPQAQQPGGRKRHRR